MTDRAGYRKIRALRPRGRRLRPLTTGNACLPRCEWEKAPPLGRHSPVRTQLGPPAPLWTDTPPKQDAQHGQDSGLDPCPAHPLSQTFVLIMGLHQAGRVSDPECETQMGKTPALGTARFTSPPHGSPAPRPPCGQLSEGPPLPTPDAHQ